MISPETRMMGLPYGEEIMIVGRTVWTQSMSVTDRQTDGRTDRIMITKTVQRIASHGNKRNPSPWEFQSGGTLSERMTWHGNTSVTKQDTKNNGSLMDCLMCKYKTE